MQEVYGESIFVSIYCQLNPNFRTQLNRSLTIFPVKNLSVKVLKIS
jgi:hypothetical protein